MQLWHPDGKIQHRITFFEFAAWPMVLVLLSGDGEQHTPLCPARSVQINTIYAERAGLGPSEDAVALP